MLKKLNDAATVALILAVGWFAGVMTGIGADVFFQPHAVHGHHGAKWHGKTEAGRKFARRMGAL